MKTISDNDYSHFNELLVMERQEMISECKQKDFENKRLKAGLQQVESDGNEYKKSFQELSQTVVNLTRDKDIVLNKLKLSSKENNANNVENDELKREIYKLKNDVKLYNEQYRKVRGILHFVRDFEHRFYNVDKDIDEMKRCVDALACWSPDEDCEERSPQYNKIYDKRTNRNYNNYNKRGRNENKRHPNNNDAKRYKDNEPNAQPGK